MTKLDFRLLFWLSELITSFIIFQDRGCVCSSGEMKPPSCSLGSVVCSEREAACASGMGLLEVLLVRYLESVSISVLFEDRLGKIAQFITSSKRNYLTSVFLKWVGPKPHLEVLCLAWVSLEVLCCLLGCCCYLLDQVAFMELWMPSELNMTCGKYLHLQAL